MFYIIITPRSVLRIFFSISTIVINAIIEIIVSMSSTRITILIIIFIIIIRRIFRLTFRIIIFSISLRIFFRIIVWFILLFGKFEKFYIHTFPILLSSLMGPKWFTALIFLCRVRFRVGFKMVVSEMGLEIVLVTIFLGIIYEFFIRGGKIGPVYRVVL